MATLYRIRNWTLHFEKAQSRNVQTVSWVALPNKHDGKGFRRIMRRKDGVAIYGCWVLIVQVASKCPARGTLIDADGVLIDAEAVSDKTGAPVKTVEMALEALSSPEIGWVEKISVEVDAEQRLASPLIESINPLIAAMSPLIDTITTEQNRTEQQLVSLLEEGDSEFDLKCLEGVETAHLTSASVLVGFHRAAHREQPENVPWTERTLLRLIGCAVQASSESKRSKLGLFAWMVTHPSKARVNGDSTKRARALLAEHRSWIAAERAAGREVNPNVVPLPDAVEANGVPA